MANTAPQRQDRWMPRGLIGPLCIGLGALLLLASFSGHWGQAFGQTVITPTPAPRIADPIVYKTGEPGCCSPGDPVTYTIVVTNEGTADATNVVISDTLPAELGLDDVTTSKGTVTIDGNHFEVIIGTVAPGEIVTIVVHAHVAVDSPVDIIIINTAFMYSDQRDGQSSFETTIRPIGMCETPGILPPTGSPAPEPEGGTSLWLLAAGLLVLLLGVVLTIRERVLVRNR